jgi:hypothetical protein
LTIEQFEAWQEIIEEWKKVQRMKRHIQELYDQVGGTLFYILEYSKKHGISLPNRNALFQMAERIHRQMDEIESSKSGKKSDESLQPSESDGDMTEPPKRRELEFFFG